MMLSGEDADPSQTSPKTRMLEPSAAILPASGIAMCGFTLQNTKSADLELNVGESQCLTRNWHVITMLTSKDMDEALGTAQSIA